jgi:gas vesicle protein
MIGIIVASVAAALAADFCLDPDRTKLRLSENQSQSQADETIERQLLEDVVAAMKSHHKNISRGRYQLANSNLKQAKRLRRELMKFKAGGPADDDNLEKNS